MRIRFVTHPLTGSEIIDELSCCKWCKLLTLNFIILLTKIAKMSWTSRLSKADQAGFRMFKAIMTGAFIGVFAREAYIRLIWVC